MSDDGKEFRYDEQARTNRGAADGTTEKGLQNRLRYEIVYRSPAHKVTTGREGIVKLELTGTLFELGSNYIFFLNSKKCSLKIQN